MLVSAEQVIVFDDEMDGVDGRHPDIEIGWQHWADEMDETRTE